MCRATTLFLILTALPSAAEEPRRVGDLSITLTWKTGKFAIKNTISDRWGQSRDECTVIDVRLENTTRTRKIDFMGFSTIDALGRFRHARTPTLEDNFGNAYTIIKPGVTQEFGGQVGRVSIHPRKAITDRLIFEQHIASAKSLTLTIPGACLDAKDDQRFTITLAAKAAPATAPAKPTAPQTFEGTPAALVALKKVNGLSVRLSGTAEARLLSGRLYLRFRDDRGSVLVSTTLTKVPEAMAGKLGEDPTSWEMSLGGKATRADGVITLTLVTVAEAKPAK